MTQNPHFTTILRKKSKTAETSGRINKLANVQGNRADELPLSTIDSKGPDEARMMPEARNIPRVKPKRKSGKGENLEQSSSLSSIKVSPTHAYVTGTSTGEVGSKQDVFLLPARSIPLSEMLFRVLPDIMPLLRPHDLLNLMLVNREFYQEGLRWIYRSMRWDIYDRKVTSLMLSLVSPRRRRYSNPLNWASGSVAPLTFLRHLHLSVGQEAGRDHEIYFRLMIFQEVLPHLEFLQKLSLTDNRTNKKETKYTALDTDAILRDIIWSEGTKRLETLEIVFSRDVRFFLDLGSDYYRREYDTQTSETLPKRQKLVPKYIAENRRQPTIRNLLIKSTHARHSLTGSVLSLERSLSTLLHVLTPSLKSLQLLSLAKPPYLPHPTDVGTDEWGGSVGVILRNMGKRGLIHLECLTIEGADTRYEKAEDAILKFLSDRSIYAAPTSADIKEQLIKQAERELRGEKTPVEHELCEAESYYLNTGNDHLHCGISCSIHGTTSGTFSPYVPIKSSRDRHFGRRFRELHLINCSDPWPALFSIGLLHPPSTLHFSIPHLDASTSDTPLHITALKVWQQKKKPFEIAALPPFADLTTGGVGKPGRNRLSCTKIKRQLEGFMSILEQSGKGLENAYRKNMKRVELRTIDKISMSIMEYLVKCFGEGLEVVGLGRLDGECREAPAGGHLRGWGKILSQCKKLKELKIVWNLFDGVEDSQDMGFNGKIGVGERLCQGKEMVIHYDERYDDVGASTGGYSENELATSLAETLASNGRKNETRRAREWERHWWDWQRIAKGSHMPLKVPDGKIPWNNELRKEFILLLVRSRKQKIPSQEVNYHFPLAPGDTTIYRISTIAEHNRRMLSQAYQDRVAHFEKKLTDSVWESLTGNVYTMDGVGFTSKYLRVKFAEHNSLTVKGCLFYEDDECTGTNGEVFLWKRPIKEVEQTLSGEDRLILRDLETFLRHTKRSRERVRIMETLLPGLKAFTRACFVLAEEIPTLERIIGVLENGREVMGRVVRGGWKDGKQIPEMIVIRCLACGGGWAGASGVKECDCEANE